MGISGNARIARELMRQRIDSPIWSAFVLTTELGRHCRIVARIRLLYAVHGGKGIPVEVPLSFRLSGIIGKPRHAARCAASTNALNGIIQTTLYRYLSSGSASRVTSSQIGDGGNSKKD